MPKSRAQNPVKRAHAKTRTKARPAPRRARGRPSKENGGEATRERILDAAEELFAQHGFDGVTIRQVTRKANVDVALAHYYFGTKRGLFDSVFLRRAAILNEARLKSIDEYQVGPGPSGATIEGFIQAFLDPVMDYWAKGGAGWKNYLAIVAQVNNTPRWGGETMARYFDPVIHRLIDALRGIMPGAQDADLYWSYEFLSGALTLTFAETGRIELLSSGVCRSADYDAVKERLAPFIAAGFRHVCGAKKR
ncbi:MAG: TetR/AcrR family transcriptional regulator [Rhizomicrobium sp.]|jgi:AcrR family transcriptional regulator